jgi:valyl-tRNA synthetase
LIHPIAPFVTEEIRERLRDRVPGASKLLTTEQWPVAEASARDTDAEGEIGLLIEIVGALRSVRDDLKVPFRAPIRAVLRPSDAAMAKRVAAVQERAKALVNLGSVDSAPGIAKPPASATKVVPGLEIFVPTGRVGGSRRRGRAFRSRSRNSRPTSLRRRPNSRTRDSCRGRSPKFVAKEREQLADAEARIAALKTNLADLG